MRSSRNAATAISLAAFNTAGRRPTRLEGPVSERQTFEPLEVGRLELEPHRRVEIHGWEAHVEPLGIGERVLDRHPHVGDPELGDEGAVFELDHRVDRRLRVDDDAHLVGAYPERASTLR